MDAPHLVEPHEELDVWRLIEYALSSQEAPPPTTTTPQPSQPQERQREEYPSDSVAQHAEESAKRYAEQYAKLYAERYAEEALESLLSRADSSNSEFTPAIAAATSPISNFMHAASLLADVDGDRLRERANALLGHKCPGNSTRQLVTALLSSALKASASAAGAGAAGARWCAGDTGATSSSSGHLGVGRPLEVVDPVGALAAVSTPLLKRRRSTQTTPVKGDRPGDQQPCRVQTRSQTRCAAAAASAPQQQMQQPARHPRRLRVRVKTTPNCNVCWGIHADCGSVATSN
ncbi:unnamed protein product [Polarella glacialis]|uniref:Uncharacterized protein n=1 Tax=Polarella glacialis TaxID=89957 RepID=A0A813JH02_POLGL|nr:unnamed protein product [Polarella glacialis]